MAACRSLQHMFENPLPESPTTLLGSLSSSWNQIEKSTNPIEDHPSSASTSLTDLFGELHFQDNPHHQQFQPSNLPIIPSTSSSSSSPSSSLAHLNPNNNNNSNNERTTAKKPSSSSSDFHKNSDSFSSMNSESLQLCTESLGFESSDDVEDLSNNDCWRQGQDERISITRHDTTTPHYENRHLGSDFGRSRIGSGRTFPPPISSIGQSGKPWVCFKSYRSNGRFILKEIRVPTREFLHACREDGRLKLQFVQSDGETLDEEDGKEEQEEDEEEEEEEEEENSDDNQEDGDRDN